MAIKKTILIDEKEVVFKASATIPRTYRLKFGRDIFKDLQDLSKSVDKADENNSNLDMFSLEVFENIAYTMAKHADPNVPNSPEEWLEEFKIFSIYQVLPEIIELWGLNVEAKVNAKKQLARLNE